MWRPDTSSKEPTQNSSPATAPKPKSRRAKGKTKTQDKGKGKDTEFDHGPLESASAATRLRIVWIRVHPVAFDDVFKALQEAASLTLSDVNRQGQEAEIELADLRGQLNVFEITGPKANQVIKGSLSPVGEDQRGEFKKFWSSFGNIQTSGSMPRGMVIGMKVHDPRLKFPPKNTKVYAQTGSSVSEAVSVFPSATLAQSEIWEQTVRGALQKPRYKKKDLDARRSKLLVPGTPLSPLRQDDRVPVLMIQRSLEPTCVNSNSEALHGWTLVLPAGWTMPLLSSLIYTGTRVGGQRERQTQAFESGLAYYPQDYPCTSAYARQAQDKEAEEKHKWEKTPKAKRANWSKLGTRSPWHADWEVVLGLKAAPEAAPDTVEDLVTTQREDPTVLKEPEEGDGSEKSRQAWLFCGPAAPDILESCCKIPDPPTGLLSEINRLRSKHHQHPLSDTTSADGLWNTALVMVRLTMHRRGVPSRLAAIYCLDDTELNKWRATDGTDEHSAAGVELGRINPSHDSIIGYVTTGQFSLSRGEGFSIGSIAVSQYLKLKQQAQRLQHSTMFVKVRDRDGGVCRLACLEVLEG